MSPLKIQVIFTIRKNNVILSDFSICLVKRPPLHIYILKTMKNESLLCFCATRFTAVAALQA